MKKKKKKAAKGVASSGNQSTNINITLAVPGAVAGPKKENEADRSLADLKKYRTWGI